MTNYEMVEKLSEKMGVTMEEAKAALEACEWDMLDAALMLEKARGDEKAAYSTRQETKTPYEEGDRGDDRVLPRIGAMIKKLFDVGNRNRFEVRRRDADEIVLELPTTVMVLLLVFAFWVCVPLLVIGLFAGFRYSFSGAELGRESINNAMDKAADAADKVMGEIHDRGNRKQATEEREQGTGNKEQE